MTAEEFVRVWHQCHYEASLMSPVRIFKDWLEVPEESRCVATEAAEKFLSAYRIEPLSAPQTSHAVLCEQVVELRAVVEQMREVCNFARNRFCDPHACDTDPASAKLLAVANEAIAAADRVLGTAKETK